MAKSASKPRGRPVEYEMPEQIPDTPENLAKVILNTPPKKEEDWEYMKKSGRALPASAKKQRSKKGRLRK